MTTRHNTHPDTTPTQDTHNITPALLDRAQPIRLLDPHPQNARTRDDRAEAELRSSLQTNGQYRTVVARRRGRGGRMQLLAGHGTVEAARQLGWTHVAVDVHEGLSDEAAARIVLVDNRTSDLAGYDDALLAELLSSLPDLEGTGYDPGDLADLLSGGPCGPGLTDVDDAPVPPDVPLSRPGDVWLLGEHRLVCGDATQGHVWDALLGGGRRGLCVD